MRRRAFIAALGGAAAWPLVARAQQAGGLTRIGFLPVGSSSSSSDLMLVDAFREGLRDAGLIEERNVVIDMVWVADESQYPQMNFPPPSSLRASGERRTTQVLQLDTAEQTAEQHYFELLSQLGETRGRPENSRTSSKRTTVNGEQLRSFN